MAGFATRTSFSGHTSLGVKTAHELRFALGHPVGADRERLSESARTMSFGFRRHTAMSSACNTASVVWQLCIDQPMTRWENKSITTAR
jgi:hypothetical protein